MRGLQIATVLCSFVGFLLLIISLASDYWINHGARHMGLWKVCDEATCFPLGTNVTGVMHATRAFMLIGMFIAALSCFALCATFGRSQFGSYSLAKIAAISGFLAGLSILIAMSAITGASGANRFYSWSFGLGWASIPMFIITGALAYQLHRVTAA